MYPSLIFVPLLSISTLLYANQENNATVHPLIEKYDHNKDGKIFYTEASKKLQEAFCQYDVNQDGFLDSDEVMALK